jgi:phage replication O-like protein O
MASPQLEEGRFTRIHNDIMEALGRTRIPGEARQVLDIIIRKTYGYQKKVDAIALSQFCLASGLSKVHVCRAIATLKAMNLITQKGNDIANTYSFNKDFDTWKPLPKKVTLPKKVMSVTQKGNLPLPKKVHTKENITKENITKEIVFPDFISPFTWESFKEYRKKIKKPLTEKAIELTIKKLIAYHAKGHNVNEILETSIVNGWTGIFEPRSNGNSSGPLDAAGRELKYL